MRILHLLSSKKFSGAENVVCQIIDLFREEQGVAMVYCSPNGDIRESLGERNIPFLPLEKLSYNEVKKAINTFKPDIIHAHDIRASIIAAMVAKNKTVISHIHGNHDNMNGITLKALLYYFFSHRYKHIFWVSKSALEKYKFYNRIKGKSSVLYNIINKETLINKLNEDMNEYSYDCIFLGRLSYPKNPQRLIELFSLILSKKPDIRIAVVGDGELKKETFNIASELKIKDKIAFLGYKKNPYKILNDSKVMVMTSRYEGTPMCALEAMALGVPIVSTPTDGLVDVVDDGETGFLSENDDVLADRIISIIEDNELHGKLSGQSMLRFNEICDLDKYKNALLKVYGI